MRAKVSSVTARHSTAGLCVAVLTLAFATTGVAQETDQKLTAAELAAAVSQPVDGRASNNFWKGPGYVVQAVLRAKPGEVEIHTITADVFIVQEGHAEVLLGGTVAGGRDSAANERRGGTITDGHKRDLAPGDVLWIPAGEPHQVYPTGDAPFRYLVVKINTMTSAPNPPAK